MEKLLEHCRTVHIALVAVCAAAMAFAVVAGSTQEARDARLALERLRDLSFATARDNVQKQGLHALAMHRIPEAIAAAAGNTGLPLTQANFDFFEEDRILPLERHIATGTLSDVAELLQQFDKVTLIIPKASELQQVLATELPRFQSEFKGSERELKFSFSTATNRPEEGLRFSVSWPHQDASQRAHGISRLKNLTTPSFQRMELSDISLKRWMTTQLLTTEPLDRVRPFWNELKAMRIDASVLSLKLLEARSDEKLEILGLKFHSSVASLAAVLAALVLLTYLTLQMRQGLALLRSDVPPDLSFPWFALYADPMSTVAAYSSIAIIPALTVGALILRSWNTQELSTWIAIMYVALISASVVCTVTLSRLRQTALDAKR